MKPEAKTDDWRSKYLDSLDKLDAEKQRFNDLEAALKRLTGRLCIATLGLSPKLDAEVKRLQSALKRDTSKDELEQLMGPLTDAIHALDDKTAAPVEVAGLPSNAPKEPTATPDQKATADKPVSAAVTPAAPAATTPSSSPLPTPVADYPQIRATLSALLSELKQDPALQARVDALDAELGQALSAERLTTLMPTITELVGKRMATLDKARVEAESLLAHMLERLEEIGQFVVDQSQNQRQALASSESFNAQITGEMKAMGDSVDSAADLGQLRAQVRLRLDAIGHHLQDFRQRESARAEVMRAKNEEMQARVTQLESEAQKLQHQLQAEQQVALQDALTKLPNRLAYDKRIADELVRWQRFGQPLCIAAWDIDHFKRINDTWGHRAGDKALQSVANALRKRARATDFIGRYGGEEFVMILPGSDVNGALVILEELRVAISNLKLHFKGTPVPLTASCGVTQLRQGDSAESAFERADKAMYQAKQSGRNRCLQG